MNQKAHAGRLVSRPARYSAERGLIGSRRAAEVIMSREDFEALRADAEEQADLALARARLESLDRRDLIPIEVVKAHIAGAFALRAWRKYRGLTLVQLAQASGLTQPFLSQLERGVREPTTSTLRKLAKALGIKPGDLL